MNMSKLRKQVSATRGDMPEVRTQHDDAAAAIAAQRNADAERVGGALLRMQSSEYHRRPNEL